MKRTKIIFLCLIMLDTYFIFLLSGQNVLNDISDYTDMNMRNAKLSQAHYF